MKIVDPLSRYILSLFDRYDKKPAYRYSGCHSYDVSALNIVLGQAFGFDEAEYVSEERFFVLMSEEVENREDLEHENGTTTTNLFQENPEEDGEGTYDDQEEEDKDLFDQEEPEALKWYRVFLARVSIFLGLIRCFVEWHGGGVVIASMLMGSIKEEKGSYDDRETDEYKGMQALEVITVFDS